MHLLGALRTRYVHARLYDLILEVLTQTLSAKRVLARLQCVNEVGQLRLARQRRRSVRARVAWRVAELAYL